MAGGWLTRSQADVPDGDAWLSQREQAVQAGLRFSKRREDWRLGRWTAKAALGPDVEILAAVDGAPEPWRGAERLPVSLSLSHRAGLCLAVVAPAPCVVGCDVELLEPRSEAFVSDWLTPSERALAGADARLIPNLVWTAKEAAAKVRREGLRLDVRSADTRLEDGAADGWAPLTVAWPDGETRGWWRIEGDFVLTVAAAPGGPPPARLEGGG